jgi:very-short-patch-repair endonuclease
MIRKFNNIQDKKLRQKLRSDATPQEAHIWNYLKNSNLEYKFRRQHGIGPYVVDFVCPKRKIIVEIDGSQHMDAEQYDRKRDEYLRAKGYMVLRFWNSEINTAIKAVVQRIYDALHSNS